MSKKISVWIGFVLVLVTGLFIWSAHRFLYELSGIVLDHFGITNDLLQSGVLMLILGVILIYKGEDLIKLFGK